MEAEEQHRMDDTPDRPALYATEATRAGLGWIGDKVPEISGMDTLVITKDDISGEYGYVGSTERLKDIFQQAGFPPDYFAPDTLSDLAENIILDNTSAWGFDFDEDGQNDFGIIIAPDFDKSPAENIGEFAGIPADLISNVSGDAEDHLAFIMFHESVHLTQSSHLDAMYEHVALAHETHADQGAVNLYQDAIKEGRDLDPAVLEEVRDARVVGGLQENGTLQGAALSLMGFDSLGAGPSHATGLFLELDNGLPQPEAGLNVDAIMDMSQVNMAVNMVVGARAFEEIGEKIRDVEEEEGLSDREVGNRINDVLYEYGLTSEDLIDIAANPLKMGELGASYGAANPEASYAALQTLNEKGFIDHPSYVERVEHFYQNHVEGIEEDPSYLETKSWIEENLPDKADLPEVDNSPATNDLENYSPYVKAPPPTLG